MKFGQKIKSLRREANMTQENLAELLSISPQAISRWETDAAMPDVSLLPPLANLFNVTTDYLLNDDHEGETDIPLAEDTSEESNPLKQKKKHLRWLLIPAVCLVLLVAYFVGMDNGKLADEAHDQPEQSLEAENETHDHPELIRVIENEVAPTCTEQGSYDEVIYCTQCGKEVLRTHILKGVPAHQFENQKCVICGKEQKERD